MLCFHMTRIIYVEIIMFFCHWKPICWFVCSEFWIVTLVSESSLSYSTFATSINVNHISIPTRITHRCTSKPDCTSFALKHDALQHRQLVMRRSQGWLANLSFWNARFSTTIPADGHARTTIWLASVQKEITSIQRDASQIPKNHGRICIHYSIVPW